MEDNFAKIRFNGDEDDEAAALGRHLCRRLYKSLRKSALTDITLVTDHGNPQRIEAHQSILSCSPLLRNLLLSEDQRYNEKPTVIFAGFHQDSVLSLLEFIYTGETNLQRESLTCKEFQNLAKQLHLDPPVNKIRDSKKCSECGQEFLKSSLLRTHMAEAHAPPNSPAPSVDEEKSSSVVDEAEVEAEDSGQDLMIVEDELEGNNNQEDEGFKMPDNFDIPEEIIENHLKVTTTATTTKTKATTPAGADDKVEMEKLKSMPKEQKKQSVTNTTKDLIKNLFGGEEETEEELEDKDKKTPSTPTDLDGIKDILSATSKPRVSTLQSTPKGSHLEEKRKRMMRALKRPSTVHYGGHHRSKARNKLARHGIRKRHKHHHKRQRSNDHVCTSACQGKHVMSEDEEWIIKDSEEEEEDDQWKPDDDSSSTASLDDLAISDEDDERPRGHKRSRDEKEESDDGQEETSSPDKSRRDRLLERREREGLLWMESGGKNRLQVSVQNSGMDKIVDRYTYKLQLMSKDESGNDSDERPGQSRPHRLRSKFEESSSSNSEGEDGDDGDDGRAVPGPSAPRSRPTKHELFKKYREKLKNRRDASMSNVKRSKSVIEDRPDEVKAKVSLERSVSLHPHAKSSEDKRRDQHGGGGGVAKNLSDLFKSMPDFKHRYGTSSDTVSMSQPRPEMSKLSFKKKKVDTGDK